MTQDNSISDDGVTDGDSSGSSSETEAGLYPVSSKWLEIGFYLLLILWMGYILWETMGWDRRQNWLFPTMIAIPTLIVLTLRVASIQYPEIVEKIGAKSTDSEEMFEGVEKNSSRTSKIERERYELYMIGWIIILPFMMYILGMGWTLLIYSFAFTYFFTRDMKSAGVVTVIVALFVWVLFIEILGLIPWSGILELINPLDIVADLRG